MVAVAYNPFDKVQQAFLGALALGETGGSSFAANEGFGGINLTGLPTDEYGFPQWSGAGNSHAAGVYQFQPNTWDALAEKYGLNFARPQDQSAGAWYLAQQTYADASGGKSLSDALSSGNFSAVQSALGAVWPSVTGNGSAPQGLANSLSAGLGVAIPGAASSSSSGAPTPAFSATSPSTWGPAIENWFIRFGLIIVGGLLILVALYFLLSNNAKVFA